MRSPERYGFYGALGTVDEGRLARLIPKGEVRLHDPLPERGITGERFKAGCNVGTGKVAPA